MDISVYERIDSFNPADAIQCPTCGMAFQVSRLEVDDEFIVDWSILYEFVPNYCPQCGKPMTQSGGIVRGQRRHWHEMARNSARTAVEGWWTRDAHWT